MVKFFMFLLPGCEKKMRIPVNFARLLTSVNKVSISSCLGKMWHVELSQDETNTYFKKGWPEFLKAHKIQLGYFMVFSYEGLSNFSIEIFDQTSCLKAYNGSAYSKIDAQRDYLQVSEDRQADDVSHDATLTIPTLDLKMKLLNTSKKKMTLKVSTLVLKITTLIILNLLCLTPLE